MLGHMTVTADTTIYEDDKITYRVDEAWLDEWPILNFFRLPILIPSGCLVTVTEDGILFQRDR